MPAFSLILTQLESFLRSAYPEISSTTIPSTTGVFFPDSTAPCPAIQMTPDTIATATLAGSIASTSPDSSFTPEDAPEFAYTSRIHRLSDDVTVQSLPAQHDACSGATRRKFDRILSVVAKRSNANEEETSSTSSLSKLAADFAAALSNEISDKVDEGEKLFEDGEGESEFKGVTMVLTVGVGGTISGFAIIRCVIRHSHQFSVVYNMVWDRAADLYRICRGSSSRQDSRRLGQYTRTEGDDIELQETPFPPETGMLRSEPGTVVESAEVPSPT